MVLAIPRKPKKRIAYTIEETKTILNAIASTGRATLSALVANASKGAIYYGTAGFGNGDMART